MINEVHPAQGRLCGDCAGKTVANCKWLGRHTEIMRSMPYGHRLLLPVRRVILTRVVFTSNPKSEWERSHSQKGLDGVTVVVEQASGAAHILEYPPKDLGESVQAVFAGIDPEDTRKAQCFPISKKLFLWQHEFMHKHSEPNRHATFNAEDVAAWQDGVTPPVLQATYADVPADDLEEDNAAPNPPPNTEDLLIRLLQHRNLTSTRKTCPGHSCDLTPQIRSWITQPAGR